MEDFANKYPFTAGIIILSLVLLSGIIVYFLARMLLNNINYAGNQGHPMNTLMLILGTVTIVALIGALFTREESAYTIAATGVGAFAGALTARAQALDEEEERTFIANSHYEEPVGEEVVEEQDDLPAPESVNDDPDSEKG